MSDHRPLITHRHCGGVAALQGAARAQFQAMAPLPTIAVAVFIVSPEGNFLALRRGKGGGLPYPALLDMARGVTLDDELAAVAAERIFFETLGVKPLGLKLLHDTKKMKAQPQYFIGFAPNERAAIPTKMHPQSAWMDIRAHKGSHHPVLEDFFSLAGKGGIFKAIREGVDDSYVIRPEMALAA